MVAAIAFTGINSYLVGVHHLPWMALLVLFVAAISYEWVGGTVAALTISVALYKAGVFPEGWAAGISTSYFLFAFTVAGLTNYLAVSRARFHQWQKQFYLQSKNLHVLREVSIALQSTLNIDKLLHIFLTSLTAGYGLGFNRALLFLKNNDSSYSGRIGIGPISVERGHKIWENVVINKFTLKDFIQLQDKAVLDDHELNAKIRTFTFAIDDDNELLQKIIENKEPYIIDEHEGAKDKTITSLRDTFSMKQLAVLPLLSRGNIIGLIFIDNIVNQKPILHQDLDNITPLATQTAMAIENAALYEKMEEMAIKDGLTGLYNKRFLDRMLPHLTDSALTNDEPLSALVLDIDYFKVYNDTNGHLQGNEVLTQLADIITAQVDQEDIVCRFGGEEFVVLLPKQGAEQAKQTGERICQAVRHHRFPAGDTQPKGKVTVSIGVATYANGNIGVDSLLSFADDALYAAKHNGKDQVYSYKGGSHI